MKKILCFIVIVIIFFGSCQEEEREFIDPRIDNRIPKDSELGVLMKNVVTHDGSFDDIVDKANCFSINLPYTIIINGELLLIEKVADYQKILTTDVLEIQYPIMITLFDHSVEMIKDITELNVFINKCMVDDDDDIECIDFVYPIFLSTFNSRTNTIGSLQVGHDSEMFEFMDDIEDEISVSINYPINLLQHDGQNINAQHNSDLLSSILKVVSTCDENDNP